MICLTRGAVSLKMVMQVLFGNYETFPWNSSEKDEFIKFYHILIKIILCNFCKSGLAWVSDFKWHSCWDMFLLVNLQTLHKYYNYLSIICIQLLQIIDYDFLSNWSITMTCEIAICTVQHCQGYVSLSPLSFIHNVCLSILLNFYITKIISSATRLSTKAGYHMW